MDEDLKKRYPNILKLKERKKMEEEYYMSVVENFSDYVNGGFRAFVIYDSYEDLFFVTPNEPTVYTDNSDRYTLVLWLADQRLYKLDDDDKKYYLEKIKQFKKAKTRH